MSDKNNGGPAFARTGSADTSGYGVPDQEGMSLRDYFAAKALQPIIAEADWLVASADSVARDAYFIADAMLKAREGA